MSAGRKSNLLKYQVITEGDLSDDLTSLVTNIQFLDNIGYQLNITGSPTGTFSVEVSIDYAQDNNGNVKNEGNWIELTSEGITAGSPAKVYFDLNQLSAPWIRVSYVRSGGTGSVDAFITGKML
jgi:hypothetical protein